MLTCSGSRASSHPLPRISTELISTPMTLHRVRRSALSHEMGSQGKRRFPRLARLEERISDPPSRHANFASSSQPDEVDTDMFFRTDNLTRPALPSWGSEKTYTKSTAQARADHLRGELAPPPGRLSPTQETVFGQYARALSEGKESSLRHLLKDPEGLQKELEKSVALATGRKRSHTPAEAMHYATQAGALRHCPERFAKFFVDGHAELMREQLLQQLLVRGANISPSLQGAVHQAASNVLGKNIHLHEVPDDGAAPAFAMSQDGLHVCWRSVDEDTLEFWSASSGTKPPQEGTDDDGTTAFRALVAAAQGKPDGEVRQEQINEFRRQLYQHLCEHRDSYHKPFADAYAAQNAADERAAKQARVEPEPGLGHKIFAGSIALAAFSAEYAQVGLRWAESLRARQAAARETGLVPY